jgi:hypothetical protein
MELVTNLRDNCPVNKQNKTGELVRTLRLALGLSQEKLAERSGGELDAIDAMTSDEVHSLVLSVWSKGYDGDPGNIQITVT